MFTLNGVVNEFVDGACVLLPDIMMFPAGCGKAEDIRRGKVAKNIDYQFNEKVHFLAATSHEDAVILLRIREEKSQYLKGFICSERSGWTQRAVICSCRLIYIPNYQA